MLVCKLCSCGSATSLHYDQSHNLLCVLTGLKHVVILSPESNGDLEPMPLWSESANHSRLEVHQINDPQFLKATEATSHRWEFDVEVGPFLNFLSPCNGKATFQYCRSSDVQSAVQSIQVNWDILINAGRRCAVHSRGILASDNKYPRDNCSQPVVGVRDICPAAWESLLELLPEACAASCHHCQGGDRPPSNLRASRLQPCCSL